MKLLVVHTSSHRVLRDRFFLPSLKDDFELCEYVYEQPGTGQFMGADWSRGIMFKCERIIDLIRESPGEAFVYADVDVQFFGPIRDLLLDAIRECDVACQLDDPQGNFCSGFFVLRASQRTLALWEGVRRGIRSEGRDQLTFNRLARNTEGLRVRHLPVRFFGAGTFTGRSASPGTSVYIPPAPIMFHANWTVGVENKLALLDQVGSVVHKGLPAITRNNWRVGVENKMPLTGRFISVVHDALTAMTLMNGQNIKETNNDRLRSVSHSTPLTRTLAGKAATLRSAMPKTVCLEVSSACQLKCPSCPTARGYIAQHLGNQFLTVENFRRFLDGHPTINQIELSNWGELFLNKSLPEILRLAHERGVALSADNGVNLNNARDGALEALVKYGLRSLTCSLDGASQSTYAQYRINGNFKQVIEYIHEINHYKEKYDTEFPRLRWQFVAFGHNEHEIAKARQMARELGMEFYFKLSWDDLYTERFSPTSDHELIRRESGLNVADRGEFEVRYGRSYNADTCRQLWTMPRIHADGRLLGCSINYWGDYGNVLEQGLEACLRGERMSYARGMVTGRMPSRADIPCANCKVYKRMLERDAWVEQNDSFASGAD